MVLSVQSKILLTVLSVVLMFALFILFYYPQRQTRFLFENYNTEIENYANTVALGVKIALVEENFEGVETALNFVIDDNRLQFVSIIQSDSIWNADHTSYTIEKSIFQTRPENVIVDLNATPDKNFIHKSAPFSAPFMNGEIIVSFSTADILKAEAKSELLQQWQVLQYSLLGFLLGIGWLGKFPDQYWLCAMLPIRLVMVI